MSKKLMLLAAGALVAVAFTALPSMASAGEFAATCPESPCIGTIAGGLAELEEDNGTTVECKKNTGTVSIVSGSKTGEGSVNFTECTVKGTGFKCNSTGAKEQEIKTGNVVAHLVDLEKTTLPVGLLLTNINVTFSCAGGLVKKTVTGNVIGEITNPECGVSKASHSILFTSKKEEPKSPQQWQQITTEGTFFDLITSPDNTTYTTSTQKAAGTITWVAGDPVTLDC